MCIINPTKLEENEVLAYKIMIKDKLGRYSFISNDALSTDNRCLELGIQYEAYLPDVEDAGVYFGFHACCNKEDATRFFNQLKNGDGKHTTISLLLVKLLENIESGLGEMGYEEIKGDKIILLEELQTRTLKPDYGGQLIA